MSSTLALLARRFLAEKVKTRSQGGKQLHYIDIPETIKRFNDVLGAKWSVDPQTHTEVTKDGDTGHYFAKTDLYMTVELDGETKRAYGVGAMVNRDPDMAAKTALAEAIKKAGHQFGIGLQLWDDRERELVDHVTDGNLKMAVQTLALIEGAEPNADSIANVLSLDPKQLQDEEALSQVLIGAGLL